MAENYEFECMWKKLLRPNLRYCVGISLEGMRETTKTLG
jgi:hypothetical protein